MRVVACLFFLIVTGAMIPLAGSGLPRSDKTRSTEAEPLVLIPKLDKDRATTTASASRQTGSPNPERIEKELDHARKTAAGAKRLFKKGVLSRVEVEQRSLRVIELESQLEDARLEQVRQEMEVQKGRFARGEISQADLTKTEQLLAKRGRVGSDSCCQTGPSRDGSRGKELAPPAKTDGAGQRRKIGPDTSRGAIGGA